MDFHFYLRLLQILWPENTSSHISRHLDFKVHYITGSPGQLVSPGRWIPGSLGRWVTKCDPVPSLVDGQTDVERTVLYTKWTLGVLNGNGRRGRPPQVVSS